MTFQLFIARVPLDDVIVIIDSCDELDRKLMRNRRDLIIDTAPGRKRERARHVEREGVLCCLCWWLAFAK